MDFEDEHYVRIYTKDTKTWLRWGWEGQTVFQFVMRKFDKAGILDDIDDPVEDVALLTGLPVEIVRVGLARVLKSETFILRGRRLLSPNYIKGQTAKRSDAARAKDSRDRRRAHAMQEPESHDVTPRHAASHNVTEHHESETDVTERHADPTPRHSTQSNAEQRSDYSKVDDVDPKDLTGSAHDVGLELRPQPPSEVFEARGTARVEREPTRPDNAKPARPVALAFSDPPPRTGSSEPAPTQPRVAQAAEPPVSRIEVNPRSHAAVLALPIEERARWLEANKDQADWAQPQSWPEVVEAIQAFYESAGRATPRLRHYKQDYAVQAMVSHYAAGETLETVVAACRSFPKTNAYLKRLAEKRQQPSAAWITVEVLRRSTDDANATAAAAAKELARRENKRRLRESQASALHRTFESQPEEKLKPIGAVPASAFAALRRV